MSIFQKYEDLYAEDRWAYGDLPDRELIDVVISLPRGPALDVAGGQGRNALALASLGFEVTLVEQAEAAVRHAESVAKDRGVPLSVMHSDVFEFSPPSGVMVVCASLFFHLPPERLSLEVARSLGEALVPGGAFYLSLPGHNADAIALARQVLEAASCEDVEVMNHVVTREERPALPVPRRNETRAFGFKS